MFSAFTFTNTTCPADSVDTNPGHQHCHCRLLWCYHRDLGIEPWVFVDVGFGRLWNQFVVVVVVVVVSFLSVFFGSETLAMKKILQQCKGYVSRKHLQTWYYPPVNKHSNGKSPSWIGNTSSNGGFSIAMLDYRSVYRLELYSEKKHLLLNQLELSRSGGLIQRGRCYQKKACVLDNGQQDMDNNRTDLGKWLLLLILKSQKKSEILYSGNSLILNHHLGNSQPAV